MNEAIRVLCQGGLVVRRKPVFRSTELCRNTGVRTT